MTSHVLSQEVKFSSICSGSLEIKTGTFQALILSRFARENLTQTPFFSAWEMTQTQAWPPGKVEGDVLLPIQSWDLVRSEMLSLLHFSHKEACCLVTSSLPALLPH